MIRITNCPGCGNPVSSEVNYCPYCGIRILSEDRGPDEGQKSPPDLPSRRLTDSFSGFHDNYREIKEKRTTTPPKRRKKGRPFTVVLILVIIAVVAVSVLTSGIPGAIKDTFTGLAPAGEQESPYPSPVPTFFDTIATPDLSYSVSPASQSTSALTATPSPTAVPATTHPTAIPPITPTPDPYSGSYGDVEYPEIVLAASDHDYNNISHTFMFQDQGLMITFPVDRYLYEAARDTDKNVYYYDYVPESVWTAGLYHAMIKDPELDDFYEDMLDLMRSMKNELSLDSDEYAELIAAYVQSIPYKTDNINTDPKYAVETVYENRGDCDDKSMLLAALLSREGYDVALFSFDEEEHMTAAVRSYDSSYKGTGYAIIETTDYSFFGWNEIQLDAGSILSGTPQVIRIGSGETPYYSGDQVVYIYTIYSGLDSEIDLLYDQYRQQQSRVNSIYSELIAMGDEMDSLMALGDTAGFNALVPEYNALVDSYNTEGLLLEEMGDSYNNHISLFNAINDRPYDRAGVYRMAKAV